MSDSLAGTIDMLAREGNNMKQLSLLQFTDLSKLGVGGELSAHVHC
jgi:hypothetical protein